MAEENPALHFLATQGFLPIPLADHPDMLSTFTSLFAKSTQFFQLPENHMQKTKFRVKDSPQAHEEGYSHIPTEKAIITVRTDGDDGCPSMLREEVTAAWKVAGDFLAEAARGIAQTLELEPDAFASLVEPCCALPKSQQNKTPTLLRMFKYYRPAPGAAPTVNAALHKDLGLLSLVVGHTPGLQVLSPLSQQWIAIEEDAMLPPDAKSRSGGLTATLLVGETMRFLTRDNYAAGIHRVLCTPATSNAPEDAFRYSAVFALRPAEAPVYTSKFESDVVGTFTEQEDIMNGESSSALFERIRTSFYSINTSLDQREKDRERVLKERSQSHAQAVRENPILQEQD